MGISTPGPSQAPILGHKDLWDGEVTASSSRMPNSSSGVKSLQFGLQSCGTVRPQGTVPGRGGARARAAFGSHREQGWGVSTGELPVLCPFPLLVQAVAAGIEAPRDGDTPV